MAVRPITVSQLNEYLARIVGTDPLLSSVTVRGEASGVKYHSSGHVYFALVDEQSRLNCFLPANYVRTLDFQLTDGMDVTLNGGVSVFKKGGSYSLYVRHIETAGEGSLAIAFEKMKKRLAAEGLFDPADKKDLPAFPRKIGVITASTGAAVRDILKIIRTRNDVCDVTVFPTPVQGEGAAEQIAASIDFVNENCRDIDVLIVGRGGGSAEDLWAFNEECVARSIYASRIPVISAVGHEIDWSISDLAADRRAETPTAAAQMAVPDTGELREQLEKMQMDLGQQLNNRVMYYSMMAENMARTLKDQEGARIKELGTRVESLKTVLAENDPRTSLASGYAIVEDGGGHVVTSADAVAAGKEYKVTFAEGWATARFDERGGEGNE